MDDDLRPAERAVMASIDALLVALETDGEAAAAARAAEDAMEDLHDLLEQSYGIGLVSDWTDLDDPYDGPVVRVRLAFAVLNEQARDDVLGRVDQRLCQGLGVDRFAILSTTLVLPGARGCGADTRAADWPRALAPASCDLTDTPPRLGSELGKLREHLSEALHSLLEALDTYGRHPRKKTRRRVYKQQGLFETRVERLHRKVLRRTGTPLVSTWAYFWDELPWSGPVILRTVFDVAEGESQEDLLTAIARTLEGLAPDDFRLASATTLRQ